MRSNSLKRREQNAVRYQRYQRCYLPTAPTSPNMCSDVFTLDDDSLIYLFVCKLSHQLCSFYLDLCKWTKKKLVKEMIISVESITDDWHYLFHMIFSKIDRTKSASHKFIDFVPLSRKSLCIWNSKYHQIGFLCSKNIMRNVASCLLVNRISGLDHWIFWLFIFRIPKSKNRKI